MPDHPTNLVAVGFLFFPEFSSAAEFPPAAEPSLVVKPPLVAKPHELEPRENFEEDCCLLSCLRNMYVISFRASSIFCVSSKTALMFVNLRLSNGVEILGFSNLMNFTILLSIDVFVFIQSLKIQW